MPVRPSVEGKLMMLRSEVGKVDCWQCGAAGRNWAFGLHTVLGGQHCDENFKQFWRGLHKKHTVQREFSVPTERLQGNVRSRNS